MEIGLFQLENLCLTQSKFSFLDLRESRRSTGQAVVDNLLARAIAIPLAQVEEHLSVKQTPKDFPVILVCADGKLSGALSDRLASAGYKNVYVVKGGVLGLLSEF